jgi:hypothetical protein
MNSVELLKSGLSSPNEEWKSFEDWLKETQNTYIENLSWNEYTVYSKQYLIEKYEIKAKSLRSKNESI